MCLICSWWVLCHIQLSNLQLLPEALVYPVSMLTKCTMYISCKASPNSLSHSSTGTSTDLRVSAQWDINEGLRNSQHILKYVLYGYITTIWQVIIFHEDITLWHVSQCSNKSAFFGQTKPIKHINLHNERIKNTKKMQLKYYSKMK